MILHQWPMATWVWRTRMRMEELLTTRFRCQVRPRYLQMMLMLLRFELVCPWESLVSITVRSLITEWSSSRLCHLHNLSMLLQSPSTQMPVFIRRPWVYRICISLRNQIIQPRQLRTHHRIEKSFRQLHLSYHPLRHHPCIKSQMDFKSQWPVQVELIFTRRLWY